MEYRDVIVKVIEAQHQKIWSLEEVKNYLRVSHSYDDKLIGSLVETAVSAAENFTNLSLAIKHVELTCRLNGRGVAPLKHSPVIEITKVSMVEGQQQVELHKEQYSLEASSAIVFLQAFTGLKKIVINYSTGTAPENLPFPLKHGILLHVAEMYDRQELSLSVSQQVKSLYMPYRELRI